MTVAPRIAREIEGKDRGRVMSNALEEQPTVRRLKRYPAYKDSGVDWLGEIPTHWNISRISELTTLVNGFPFDSERFVRGEGTPLVRIRDLNASETEVNYIGPVPENVWIEPGDVIVGMDGDFNVARWQGQRALLNQRMCCLRAHGATDMGFIAYLLPMPLHVINDLTYSTTVKHLSSVDVRKIRLAEPPPDEQRAIAGFLDRETAKIDALVAKKERLVELLQEKRTALITRAVTKGLDPNVTMKDSGVEWLGEIPGHWDAARMSRISSATSGGTPDREERGYWDGDIPWVSPKDMKRRFIDSSEDAITERALAETGIKLIAPPVVLIVVRGMILAHTFPVAVTTVPVTINQDIKALRFQHPVDPLFIAWVFEGVGKGLLAAVVEEAAHGTRAIRMDQWRSVLAPVPPIMEQHAIAAFLDQETVRIDALVAKVRDAVGRLKELRTALISAAVTGKIDLREEAAA